MKLKQLLLFIIILLASCWISFSLVAQTTVGMLAHFKMDGSITNLGSANVTGTAIGTSYTTNNAGVANKAIQFAGTTSSYIDFVDNGNLDFPSGTNFTISFSFYFNGISNSGLIDNCLNYGGWGVWFWTQQSGVWNIQFNYKNGSVGSSAATNFTLNQWHHVATVRNNGTLSVYIDGVFRLSAAEGTTAPSYPINMIAGAMAYGSFSPPRYNPLNGKLDELRIYNRALSAAEISELGPSLPLKMGEFTAVKQPSGIQLNWETITEQNTSHFEIERSADGINYVSIGRVNASGNSADKKYYSYTDGQPLSGTNFYRLKLTDIDGAFTYSKVIAVKNISNLITLELFPNPVSDVLQVQLPSRQKGTVQITIIDAAGRQVYLKQQQINEGNNAISIPVQQLPKGNYWLVIDNKEDRQSKTFIRQ